MRTAKQRKGIFCIEGNWESDLRKQSSVRPALELLRLNAEIPYIYREAATVSEFEYYIDKWPLTRYSGYPVLYLPIHGTQDGILLDDGELSLDDLAETLGARCKGRIVIVGSCNTMSVNRRVLLRFLTNTHALAVCGYRTDVDWMKSTAFEFLVLSAMQDNEFSKRGIDSMVRKLDEYRRAFRELEFRIVTSKELPTGALRPAPR